MPGSGCDEARVTPGGPALAPTPEPACPLGTVVPEGADSGPCGDLLGALARWLCPSPWLLEVLLELTQDRKFPSFPAGPEQTGQAEGWGGGWQGRGPCGVQTLQGRLPGSHHAALGSAAHSGPGLCLGPQLYQALRGLSSKWGGGPSSSSGLHLGSAQGLHGRGSRTLGLWPSQQDPDHRVGGLHPRPPRPGLDLSRLHVGPLLPSLWEHHFCQGGCGRALPPPSLPGPTQHNGATEA